MERVRRKFTFKNVGTIATDSGRPATVPADGIVSTPTEAEQRPIGLRTPMQPARDNPGSTFETRSDIREVLRDNLRNLLLTNYGERLGEYDFGANLIEYVSDFELVDNTDAISARIRQTISRWIPVIEVLGVETTRDVQQSTYIGFTIRVVYGAPELYPETDAVTLSYNFF